MSEGRTTHLTLPSFTALVIPFLLITLITLLLVLITHGVHVGVVPLLLLWLLIIVNAQTTHLACRSL
jgi:hypothetical protein